MSEETTTEQLAEIEEQAESTPATGYTPPEGWRVLAVGEVLQRGDVWVNQEGESRPTKRVGETVNEERYIRPIEPEPEPVQVREGRWRTRNGLVKDVTAMPTNHEDFAAAYPWWDGVSTWRNDGRWLAGGSTMDLLEYLGPIEQQPEPVPAVQGGLVRDVTHLLEESGVLDSAKAEQQIEELRSEVSYVQNLLGESRQRVTQLEELASSLRTINEAQEKAFTAAGKENAALRNQLAAVASVAADRQRLLIELDAAQQVPADSPEIRQLQADLAEVIRERDQYRHCYDEVSSHLETIEKTAKAEAVEAIAEWLQPFRGCNSPALALLLLEALPAIMRHLTGLADEEIE